MNIIFGFGDSDFNGETIEEVYNITFGLSHFSAIIEGLMEYINLNLNTKSEINLLVQDILINASFIINKIDNLNLVTRKVEENLNISVNQKDSQNTTFRY